VNLTEIDMQGGFRVLAGTARSQACQHAPAWRPPLVSTPPPSGRRLLSTSAYIVLGLSRLLTGIKDRDGCRSPLSGGAWTDGVGEGG
jgi:hypothetical protein